MKDRSVKGRRERGRSVKDRGVKGRRERGRSVKDRREKGRKERGRRMKGRKERQEREKQERERQKREREERERQARERQERERQKRERQERERQERERQEKALLLSELTSHKETFTSMGFPQISCQPIPVIFWPSLSVDQLLRCPMCRKMFTDPRTLSCLHTFCLACLETQKATALSTSSDLRCHQCGVPFTPPVIEGVGACTCNPFIDSLVKSAKANEGDVNRVVKCELCEDEDATVHCVECGENFGQICLIPHKKGKATASHQQIPLEEALAGNATMKRIPRCQKHIGFEIDTYCKTCTEAVCAKCAVEKHPKHDFCPLSQVTGPFQDQLAGYTITLYQREEAARKAITTLDDTINKIEKHRSTAEKEIDQVFDSVLAATEQRRHEVKQGIDQLRKTAVKEKGEAEPATVEFREFRTFTEGLLAQGTPHEIAGTHKMVSLAWFDDSSLVDVVVTSISSLLSLCRDSGPSQKRDP